MSQRAIILDNLRAAALYYGANRTTEHRERAIESLLRESQSLYEYDSRIEEDDIMVSLPDLEKRYETDEVFKAMVDGLMFFAMNISVQKADIQRAANLAIEKLK